MNEEQSKITEPQTSRQRVIADAERWLLERCPDTPAHAVHAEAVRIANIVLRLQVDADLARMWMS